MHRQWHIHRIIITLLFALYFFRNAFHPADRLFIYNVDFVFHEAGHMIFRILGDFMGLVGGTLMQLILPCAAAVHFYLRRQFYSAALILFWIGENWLNISIYARDARSRLLELHGGENVLHDWSEILYKLNLLHHDQAIGNIFYFLGVACMVIGLIGGIYFSRKIDDAEVAQDLR